VLKVCHSTAVKRHSYNETPNETVSGEIVFLLSCSLD